MVFRPKKAERWYKMKRTVTLLGILLVLGVNTTKGGIIYNDGGIHNIDWAYGDVVSVENSFWSEATTMNLLTGGIVSQIYAYENSKINIFGGQVVSYLSCYDNSDISVTGGKIMSELIARDNSSIDVSGGEIVRIGTDPAYSGDLTITGGITDVFSAQGGTMKFNGGNVRYVQAVGNGHFTMNNGQINEILVATDNSQVDISGGNITGLLDIRLNSTVNIIGTGFVLDGHSIFGDIINPLAEDNYGHLTGLYLDGSPFEVDIKMAPGASVSVNPEPCSLLLVVVGSLIVARKRH
jgi:hypothetical protein